MEVRGLVALRGPPSLGGWGTGPPTWGTQGMTMNISQRIHDKAAWVVNKDPKLDCIDVAFRFWGAFSDIPDHPQFRGFS